MISTVLLFQSSKHKSWRKKLAGIYSYAHLKGWQIQVIDDSTATTDIRIGPLKPIGCIMNRSLPANIARSKQFKNVPMVYLDQKPKGPLHRNCCIANDANQTAKLAAEEYLKTDIPNFAYVPWVMRTSWSDEREKAFAAFIRSSGRNFVGRTNGEDLMKLPRPCGIFCANDIAAQKVMAYANKMGLNIPSDLMFIGVDNDELICENTHPPLTSIELDFEQAGYSAAQCLDRLINGEKPPSQTYGALSLARRASSQWLKPYNRIVAKAIAFIGKNYLNPNLRTQDVCDAVGCSKRLVDLRFRELLGHSIRNEIQAQRMEKAFTLLRDPNQTISAIANLCGYSSESFFKHLFKSTTGLTMRDWRKRHACQIPVSGRAGRARE